MRLKLRENELLQYPPKQYLMKFKVDENMPVEIVEQLRKAGYAAMSVTEQNLGGEPDATIAAICRKENRAIITLDTDFADICNYPPNQFGGLIVFRLKKQDKPYILKIFKRVMKLFTAESVQQRLWIVDENRIRIRE